MSNKLKFRIQPLLEETKDGNVKGPMSPLEFAKEMAVEADFKFNRLARVWFEKPDTLQQREENSLTGYDTLIIGCQYSNDLWLSLWVDKGTGGLPVAMCYESDRKLIVTPRYRNEKFVRKLNEDEIQELFTFLLENTYSIQTKPFISAKIS